MATLFKQATGLHVVGTDAAILLSRPSCQIEMLGSAIPGQPLLATQLPKGNVHFFPALGLVKCHPIASKTELAVRLSHVAPHLLARVVGVGYTAPEQGGTKHDLITHDPHIFLIISSLSDLLLSIIAAILLILPM
jgi:hypothetical protein